MKHQLASVLAVSFVAALAWGEPPQDSPAAHHRAGNPQAVAPWAHPSISPAYIGYYVGGGCALWQHGEGRLPLEGSWGWDYTGRCLQRRVDLLWWHGRRYQGGSGQYETDGPHLRHLDNAGGDHAQSPVEH